MRTGVVKDPRRKHRSEGRVDVTAKKEGWPYWKPTAQGIKKVHFHQLLGSENGHSSTCSLARQSWRGSSVSQKFGIAEGAPKLFPNQFGFRDAR